MKNNNNTNKDFKIDSNKNKPDQKYQTANQINMRSTGSFKSEQTQKDTALSPSGIDSQNYQSVNTNPQQNTYNDNQTNQNKVNSPYPSNRQNKSEDYKVKAVQPLPNNASKTGSADGQDTYQTTGTYQQSVPNMDYNSPKQPNNLYSANRPTTPGQQNPGNIQDPYKKPAINDPQAPNTPNQYEKDQKPDLGKTWQNTSAEGVDHSEKLDYEGDVSVESHELTDNSATKHYGQTADTPLNSKQKGIDQNYDKQKPSPLETYETSDKNRNQQGSGQNNSPGQNNPRKPNK